MSRPGHPERPPGRVGVRGSLKKPRIKNMTAPLYQHVLADSVAPRIKTLAADWQVFEFALGPHLHRHGYDECVSTGVQE